MPTSTRTTRHYGLDWLRITAFGVLILYHVAMVFAPGEWVIKARAGVEGLVVPMTLVTPWRLALLFAVSGYASRNLLAKAGGPLPFLQRRSARLLVPLAFGLVALVPPEMWVRVRQHGYPYGLGHFWAFDAWHVGTFWNIPFPSWEHLWFVVYLFAYTAVVALALLVAERRPMALLDRAAAWLAEGPRLLWVPAAALVVAKLSLLFVVPEGQGLTTDWAGHALFLPMFLAGFTLAGAPSLWPVIARSAGPAWAVAAIAGAVLVGIEVNYTGDRVPSHALMALDRAAYVTLAWTMVLVLFHLAHSHWNHDHPWRATLGEAVFPFYLVHHIAIVMTAYLTLPLGLPTAVEFLILVAATVTACLSFYLVGREIGWLRPLIGLQPRARAQQPLSGVPRPG